MNSNAIQATISIEAADIPTMMEMSIGQYADYIETHLIFSDAHGVVRATQGEYPLACSQTQLKILINYLEGKIDSLEP